MSKGLRTSEAVGHAGYVAAPVSAVARAGTTFALPHQLARGPRQQRIVVVVGPGNGVGQITPLYIHIEARGQAVMRARRHPGERIRDGRPARYVCALRAIERVSRSVVPVHIDVERSLVIDQAQGECGGWRLVDDTSRIAGPGVREFHVRDEDVVEEMLPGQLDTLVGFLGAIGRVSDRP